MSLKLNLPRWLHASIRTHIASNLPGYKLIIEGEERITQDLESYFELRVNGPIIDEITRDEFKAYCRINILCVTKFNEKELYTIHKLTGIATQALSKCINIYNYGGSEDSVRQSNDTVLEDTLLGNLQLMDDIETNNFGRVEDRLDVTQSTVEANYWGCF
jgi:hypothetical protein